MTTPNTICGHDRQTFIVRLSIATLKDSGEIAQDSDEWLEELGAKPKNSDCIAVDDVIYDPAKLAGVIVELLQEGGLPIYGFGETSSWPFASVGVVELDQPNATADHGATMGIRVETVHLPRNGVIGDHRLTMPAARALTLRLLGLSFKTITKDVLRAIEAI